mgnify:CR=1 FL=1
MNDSKYGTQCDTQTFTQEYSEVSLNEVSRDLRLHETEQSSRNAAKSAFLKNMITLVSTQSHFIGVL